MSEQPPNSHENGYDETQDLPDDMAENTVPHYASLDPDDEDVPFDLPDASDVPIAKTPPPINNDLTVPVFREPGVTDPRQTLPGTGGLDPNPDMMPKQNAGATMPNMRTVPNPSEHSPYQRPNQQSSAPTMQGNVPVPPQASQHSRPKRALPRRRRNILGVRPGCFYIVLGLMLTFCGGFTLLVGGAAAFFIPQIEAEWSTQIDAIDNYEGFQSTLYFDRNGELLYEAFGEGKRSTVDYNAFPENLINATIAIEDDSYWNNIGIDVGATTVAFLQFIGADSETSAGGSTITQQLVRNVLFDFEKRTERSVQRKVEEIILAILLTNRRSKEDILTMYLNEIYYGNLAYGAQAASQTFFGKDVGNLTLGEAALLAGLPQSPSWLDPLNPDPEVQDAVYGRQRQVLDLMVEERFITTDERDAALREGLTFLPPLSSDTSLRAPHFTVYAQGELERLMIELGYNPEQIANGGFEVYTTVDLNISQSTRTAMLMQLCGTPSPSSYSQCANNFNAGNASVVVMKPLTGEIMAMEGSLNYFWDKEDGLDGSVNVATAFRQPGSTMKPFTYAAAMERGMTAGDVIWDTRTEIGIPGQPLYVPRNYDGRFHGPMTMRTALANSYNIPAVQTLRRVSVSYLLEFMRRIGVESLDQDASQYGLSLTLGGGEITLLELVNGYSVFANQGAYVPSTSILCIINSDNEVIYQYESGCPTNDPDIRFTTNTVDRTGFGRQALDPRIAFIMTDIMSDDIVRREAMGFSSPLETPNIDSAVKTGTTNDVKDNWTVGYTRNVAVGVWVGNNNGDPMVGSSGLTGAAPIWNAVMTSVYNNSNMFNQFAVGGQILPDKPNPPAGMTLSQICNVRQLSDPSPNCPSVVNEWLLDGVAGIPDGNGNLQYPPPPQQQQPDGYIQETSPGVYRALVFPLPPDVASGIQFTVGAGERQPLPPNYCIVKPEQAQFATGAQELFFVGLPTTSQTDLVEADSYARNNNLATLPIVDCWDDVFTLQNVGSGINTAIITSPSNGQTVTTDIPIMGTANFDRSQVDFYHLFIQGGPFTDYTFLGREGRNTVVNGQLEMLNIGGLPSGTYRLRLALMRDGGTVVQSPYEISFIIP